MQVRDGETRSSLETHSDLVVIGGKHQHVLMASAETHTAEGEVEIPVMSLDQWMTL